MVKKLVLSTERYQRILDAFLKQYTFDTPSHPAKVLAHKIKSAKGEQYYYLSWEAVPQYLTFAVQDSEQQVMNYVSQSFSSQLESNELTPQRFSSEFLSNLIQVRVLEKQFPFFWNILHDPKIVQHLLSMDKPLHLVVKQIIENKKTLAAIYRLEPELIFEIARKSLSSQYPNVFIRFFKRIQYAVFWFFFKAKIAAYEAANAVRAISSKTPTTMVILSAQDIPVAYSEITDIQLDKLFEGIPRFDLSREGLDKNISDAVKYVYSEYLRIGRHISTAMLEDIVLKIAEREKAKIFAKSPTLVQNQSLNKYIELRTKKYFIEILSLQKKQG